MGSFGIWHWLVLVVLVTLLFGRGRFSALMEDLARGIKTFGRAMHDADISKTPIGRDDR